jgi:putative colanic acid biosynthesis glycosyltransferase
MPKLLQINIEVNSGSTGRIAEELGIVAMESGFESYITYARGFNPSKSTIIKIGNKLSILLHFFKTRFLGEHLNGSFLPTVLLIRKIKKIKPDIIHLHQMHGYYINVPLLFKFLKNSNIPIVWTLHDCWAFTGHCSYFTLVGCDKWKSNCYKCPQFNRYPKSLFFDKSNQEYRSKNKLFNELPNLVLVGVSDWVARLANESFLKRKRITSVFNGVNTEIFKQIDNRNEVLTKYNINPERKILIASGTTWIKSKGLDDYKNLANILSENYQLVLVGVDKSIASEIPSKIVTIRRTESQKELAELYSAAEILLCLSYQESFGMTPVEAMACGTPAIVYNNTALSELINEKTGRLVPTGDLNKVVEMINEIATLGKNSFSLNCIQRAKENYDMKVTYKKYLNLYFELLIPSKL